MLAGSETLIVSSNEVYGPGGLMRTIRFRQAIRGIPVFDAEAANGVTEKAQSADGFSVQLLTDRGLPEEPSLDAQAGIDALKHVPISHFKTVSACIEIQGNRRLPTTERRLYTCDERSIWLIHAGRVTDVGSSQYKGIQIDALNGDCLGETSLVSPLRPRS